MDTYVKELTEGIERSIYVDLDALYDTRLATLELIHDDLVNSAIRGGYFHRIEDAFPMVGKPKFREVYDGRDNEVLAQALPTPVFELIKSISVNLKAEATQSPFETTNKIYLNIYPYKIPKDNIQDLVEPLRKASAGMLAIDVVNWKDENIDPHWAKHNLSVMIRYDWQEWLEVHNKSGRSTSLMSPDLGMLVPRLWLGDVPSAEEQEEIKRGTGLDHFRVLEKEVRMIYDLVFLDIGHFCAVIPPPVLAKRLGMTEIEVAGLAFNPAPEIRPREES